MAKGHFKRSGKRHFQMWGAEHFFLFSSYTMNWKDLDFLTLIGLVQGDIFDMSFISKPVTPPYETIQTELIHNIYSKQT